MSAKSAALLGLVPSVICRETTVDINEAAAVSRVVGPRSSEVEDLLPEKTS